MDREEVEKAVELIKQKFASEDVKKALKNFTRTLQMEFTDLGLSYVFYIENGELIEVKEGKIEKPDILVKGKAEDLVKVIRGEMSGVKAYSLGKMKVKGKMSDLLKLRRIFK